MASRLLCAGRMRKAHLALFLSFLSSPALAGIDQSPVVGGTPARPGEWPDVVLVVGNNALCTGTLVASDVVLTAGHCIGISPRAVLVGSVDYATRAGELIAVQKAIAYPDWQHHYDVGVLVLARPAPARPRAIASACTIASDLRNGAAVEVVGFWLTSPAGTGSNTKLNEAALVVSDATCANDPYCQPSIAPGGEFVAGGHGTDSCFGDSGGPLLSPHGAQIGVVSRGIDTGGEPCGGRGVYVRADKVVPWIEQVTGRKLVRATCTGKGDGEDPPAEISGCSAGGGAALGGALLILVALWILTIPRSATTRRACRRSR